MTYVRFTCTRQKGILNMIISFLDKETEKIFHQRFSNKLPVTIQKVALRKLVMLDNASSLSDLRVPPSNRLEKLLGEHSNRWSIRINNQWRICFVPISGGKDYAEVTTIDYH